MHDVLMTLSEPRRQAIVQLLWNGERSAGEIASAFDVTFGAVSQHLKVLHDAGVVSRRRDGRHIYYNVEKSTLGPLAEYLEAMWSDRLGALKRAAEKRARRT